MSASLRMNMFPVQWSESAQWRRVRLRHALSAAGVNASDSAAAQQQALAAWVAQLDSAAVLWHVSHDVTCVATASAANNAEPLLATSACTQHQCALWLFAGDETALAPFVVVSEEVIDEGGLIAALYARTAASLFVDAALAALHRALQRALCVTLLRSDRFQLHLHCLVENVSASARLDAPLSLADLPRRSTRLGYQFSFIAAGTLSYLVVSLHDVASLESGALLPHAALPPDVYAEHEQRVMAALVSEQSAFPTLFRFQSGASATLGVKPSSSGGRAAAVGVAVLWQSLNAPDGSVVALVDVLSPLYERRAMRPVDSAGGAQATGDFCSALTRYVDPLLSVRETATAALASKRPRDGAPSDASTKLPAAAEAGGDKKRTRAASLDGAAAAAAAATALHSPPGKSPSTTLHNRTQSMFTSPRTTSAAATASMYIPDDTAGPFTGSFSIIAKRIDNDDDSLSSSSSDSSTTTSSSSSSSSSGAVSNGGVVGAMLTDTAVAAASAVGASANNDALESAFAASVASQQPTDALQIDDNVAAVAGGVFDDDPDDKALRPPKMHRNPDPQPLPLVPRPPPPSQPPSSHMQALSSTPRGIGGSPELPTPPSLFAPSPTPARVSPLGAPLWPPVPTDSGAGWRQREQMVLASLVPRRFGAGYDHVADMATGANAARHCGRARAARELHGAGQRDRRARAVCAGATASVVRRYGDVAVAARCSAQSRASLRAAGDRALCDCRLFAWRVAVGGVAR
jgi:hypothetical protein